MRKRVIFIALMSVFSFCAFPLTTAGQTESFTVYIDVSGVTTAAFTKDPYTDLSKPLVQYDVANADEEKKLEWNAEESRYEFSLYASARVVESSEISLLVSFEPLENSSGDIVTLHAFKETAKGTAYQADINKPGSLEIRGTSDDNPDLWLCSEKVTFYVTKADYDNAEYGTYESNVRLIINSGA